MSNDYQIEPGWKGGVLYSIGVGLITVRHAVTALTHTE